MRLGDEDVEAIARRVVELLDERRMARWGDVKAVAAEFSLPEWWVYENARHLGGVKLGSEKNARWRFDLEQLREMVSAGMLQVSEDGMRTAKSAQGDARAVAGPEVAAWPGRAVPPAGRPPASQPGIGRHLRVASSSARKPPREPERGFDDESRPMAKLTLMGRFTAVNPAFSKLVGYTEAEFAKAEWPSPHDRHIFADQLRDRHRLVTGKEQQVRFVSTYMHGQGLMMQLRGVLALVRDASGDPAHILLVADRPEDRADGAASGPSGRSVSPDGSAPRVS